MSSKKDKQGYLLIGAVVAILAGFFGFKIMQEAKPKAGSDNCVGQAEISTVVLLDQSERASLQTQDEIVARTMQFVREKVSINERVTVFTVSDLSRRALKPIVSLCRPPEDGNRLVESTKLIQRRFHDNFEEPIRAALNVPSVDGKESPIAQAITDISLSQYLRGKRSQLLIFSDMLENTSAFSMYRCSLNGDVIDRYRASRKGAQERPIFQNTHIELHIIPRADQAKESLKCRDKMWPWFFGDNSGVSADLSVSYLPGGGSAATKSIGQLP